MTKIITICCAIIGFVVAFFKTYVVPSDKSFDHGGKQTFTEKAKSVSVEVSLRLNAWLSGLQHSPTA